MDGERQEELEREVADLRKSKDEAYEERNRLVAAFARMALRLGWPAGVGEHEERPGEDWEPDWRTLVVVETPWGQASWHLHDSHRHLVQSLPRVTAKWDGHDTPTKYERLDELVRRLDTLARSSTSSSASSLTHEELIVACKNVGVDLSCGACAEVFFTGWRVHSCQESCVTWAPLGTRQKDVPVDVDPAGTELVRAQRMVDGTHAVYVGSRIVDRWQFETHAREVAEALRRDLAGHVVLAQARAREAALEEAARSFDGLAWSCLDHGGEEVERIQAHVRALAATAKGGGT